MTIDYQDKTEQRKIRHIFSAIDLCGCGSDDKWEIVRDLLARAEAKQQSLYEPLGDIPGRGVEFIAHVMTSKHWDLLDHGTSIGWSSLTDRGSMILQFFKDFGTDADAWPTWWCSVTVGEEW